MEKRFLRVAMLAMLVIGSLALPQTAWGAADPDAEYTKAAQEFITQIKKDLTPPLSGTLESERKNVMEKVDIFVKETTKNNWLEKANNTTFETKIGKSKKANTVLNLLEMLEKYRNDAAQPIIKEAKEALQKALADAEAAAKKPEPVGELPVVGDSKPLKRIERPKGPAKKQVAPKRLTEEEKKKQDAEQEKIRKRLTKGKAFVKELDKQVFLMGKNKEGKIKEQIQALKDFVKTNGADALREKLNITEDRYDKSLEEIKKNYDEALKELNDKALEPEKDKTKDEIEKEKVKATKEIEKKKDDELVTLLLDINGTIKSAEGLVAEAAEKAAEDARIAKEIVDKAEADRVAKEKADKEIAEKAKADKEEAERKDAEAKKKADEDARIAKEIADKAEADRVAKEKVDKEEADRKVKEEAERLAKEAQDQCTKYLEEIKKQKPNDAKDNANLIALMTPLDKLAADVNKALPDIKEKKDIEAANKTLAEIAKAQKDYIATAVARAAEIKAAPENKKVFVQDVKKQEERKKKQAERQGAVVVTPEDFFENVERQQAAVKIQKVERGHLERNKMKGDAKWAALQIIRAYNDYFTEVQKHKFAQPLDELKAIDVQAKASNNTLKDLKLDGLTDEQKAKIENSQKKVVDLQQKAIAACLEAIKPVEVKQEDIDKLKVAVEAKIKELGDLVGAESDVVKNQKRMLEQELAAMNVNLPQKKEDLEILIRMISEKIDAAEKKQTDVAKKLQKAFRSHKDAKAKAKADAEADAKAKAEADAKAKAEEDVRLKIVAELEKILTELWTYNGGEDAKETGAGIIQDYVGYGDKDKQKITNVRNVKIAGDKTLETIIREGTWNKAKPKTKDVLTGAILEIDLWPK